MIYDINGMTQPNQAVKEWTDEDYKNNLRFIASQYNQSLNNVPLPYTNDFATSANSSVVGSNYINEYFNNLQYVFGNQIPAGYSFFVKDAAGNNTQTPLIRGLDIYSKFNYLQGEITDIINPIPKILNVSSYSVGAISAKKNMMDYMKFQIDQVMFLKILEDEAGFSFKAIDRDFENQEQIDAFFTNFQESMEIAYERIARHITYFNKYQIKLPKVFGHVFIGNLGMICVDYENGQVHWRIVTPDTAVVDYSKGLDVHEDDDFAGEVYQLTIPELFRAYDWTDEEQEELKQMAANDMGEYNTYYTMYAANNITWWATQNNVRKVTVVKAQWVSLAWEDNDWKMCLREGEFIGNKFLKNAKISHGQVWDKQDKGKKRLRYRVVTPNLFMGTSISTIGIIKRFADLRDAFLTKVVDMASKAFGKVAIIRASKLPEGMRTPDVIGQFKQAGVLVVEGEETEDLPTGTKIAEVLDLTIDPSITAILSIAQYFEQLISDVLNIPNSVRGQMKDYQSTKQIDVSQVQSTKGLSYLFNNYQLFIKDVLSYSADLMKLMAPDDEMGREYLSVIVGDATAELLSMESVRKSQFEDFLLDLNPNDYTSEKDKAELTQLMIQTATSGAPRKVIKDYIALKRLESLTEMQNYLDAEIYKDDKREAERLAAEQEMAMMQNQNNNATQEALVDKQTNATLEKAAMDNQTKLMLKDSEPKQPPRR